MLVLSSGARMKHMAMATIAEAVLPDLSCLDLVGRVFGMGSPLAIRALGRLEQIR